MSSLGTLLKRLRDDPTKFNRVALGRPEYWTKQQEVARSWVECPVSLVPSGHSVGKTYLAAGLALSYLCTNPDSVVLVYAPSQNQLKNALWPELLKAWNRKRIPMPGRVIKSSPPRIQISDKWYLQCFSADGDAERLQGVHAGKLAIICDESSWPGYDQVLESILSQSPDRLLLIGNPIRRNIFHRLCTTPGENKRVIPISTLDGPHVDLDRSPYGLADKGMLDLFRSTWGEDSLVWKVRILGQWPDDSTEILIPSAWWDRCSAPHVPGGDRWLTIDLSAGTGSGDLCCWNVRDRNGIIAWDASGTWPYPDDVARRVILAARQHQVHPSRVIVDATGLGAAFTSVLAMMGLKGARGYVGAATGGIEGVNLRSCSAIALRDRLNPSLNPQPFHIPEPLLSKLKHEAKELRYEVQSQGRVFLEAKKDMAQRLGHSPDHLDSLIMSWAY